MSVWRPNYDGCHLLITLVARLGRVLQKASVLNRDAVSTLWKGTCPFLENGFRDTHICRSSGKGAKRCNCLGCDSRRDPEHSMEDQVGRKRMEETETEPKVGWELELS